MQTLDLIIIGAGAAGIAAAREARARGLDFRVLEARERIGGRAYTDTGFGFPVDHGCHWLHTADLNPLTRLADTLGRAYRSEPGHALLHSGGDWADAATLADWENYCERCFAAADEAGAAGRDVALAAVIPDHPRWRPTFDNWCAALNGLEPAEVSTLDHYRYVDTGLNYPVVQGYGALIHALASNLPVSLATPVQRIRWGENAVRVDTPRGTLSAHRVLLTVSVGVLASDTLRFDPPLPVWKQEACHDVVLGQANKVMFRLKAHLPGVADNSYGRLDRGSPRTLGFHCHGFGQPLVTAYLAGRSGEELERAGSDAMLAFARESLVAMFGSQVLTLLDGVQLTGWGSDPHIRGAYSLARPGRADARERLGKALAGRLYFAGEAVSATAFGTAHGAWESGIAAIQQSSGAGRA